MSGKLITKNNLYSIIFAILFVITGLFVNSANAQTYNTDTVANEWVLRTESEVYRIKFSKDGNGLRGVFYDVKKLKQVENVFFASSNGKSYIRFQLPNYGYFNLQIKTNKKCEGTVVLFRNGNKVPATMSR